MHQGARVRSSHGAGGSEAAALQPHGANTRKRVYRYAPWALWASIVRRLAVNTASRRAASAADVYVTPKAARQASKLLVALALAKTSTKAPRHAAIDEGRVVEGMVTCAQRPAVVSRVWVARPRISL